MVVPTATVSFRVHDRRMVQLHALDHRPQRFAKSLPESQIWRAEIEGGKLLILNEFGAGDRGRTGDVQLGNLPNDWK